MSNSINKSPSIRMPNGLSIGYNESLATVSDSVELEGGTHYLLARNGRGKTTLLRTLAGVLKPIDGRHDCDGACQFLGEDMEFDRELPAKIILKSLLNKEASKKALHLAERLELDVNKPYGKLSTGNKRKVLLLVAEFSVDPKRGDILLLDEPFTGLDAFAREIFQEMWKERDDSILRLVSCHPDFDSMKVESAVLISDGAISHLTGEGAPEEWGELKGFLN
ncbi:MAG: ATP-binding cassette domain-containing protein [Akkermansiaceae bacterium]